MTDAGTRTEVAVAAARDGGEEALESFRSALAVETKANKNDLVTSADRAAQRAVVDRIRSTFPGESIVAEEGDERKTVPETGSAWVIDPIDGTANYARGQRLFTTSVAAVVDGDPIGAASVLPAMSDAYAADRERSRRNGERIGVSDRADPETFAVAVLGGGAEVNRARYAGLCRAVIDRCGDMRRLGSMQTALAFVASGELDAAITTRQPAPWDSIAGAHLIERAGGAVTDLDGRPWRHDAGPMVASNGRAHEVVLEAARDARRSA